MERVVRYYSHDYPDDTKIEYLNDGKESHLKLSFTSEDPDYGTEEMEYNSTPAISFKEMAKEQLEEITRYLDYKENPNGADAETEHTENTYYDDFGKTSLYAFEAALMERRS